MIDESIERSAVDTNPLQCTPTAGRGGGKGAKVSASPWYPKVEKTSEEPNEREGPLEMRWRSPRGSAGPLSEEGESDSAPQLISLSLSDVETDVFREMHLGNLAGRETQAAARNLPAQPAIPIKKEMNLPIAQRDVRSKREELKMEHEEETASPPITWGARRYPLWNRRRPVRQYGRNAIRARKTWRISRNRSRRR